MRILVCNWRDKTHPGAGGAEVYTEEVLRRWAAWGHDITLFSAAVEGRPAEEDLDGIHRVRLGSKLGVYREAPRWYRRWGQGHFDLVIDETNTHPFFCHEWVHDAPVVALFHQTCEEIWGHEMTWPLSTLGRRVLEPRWLARMRTVPTLVVSESTKQSLARFGFSDLRVVPEGLTLPTGLAPVAKEATPTIVHVGRLVSYKRVDHVMEAFTLARRSLPDLRLWVVGGGPEEARLRRQAPEGAEVLGFVSQAEKYDRMMRANAMVMASVREGWGLVVAEAAALGTPTIGYDVPGVRDAIAASGGVLVPPTPEALAAWIVSVTPRWVANPPAPVAHGGVEDWDTVATEVFDAALSAAGLVPRLSVGAGRGA